ncbi:hypothetical protein MUS1_06245 [Marinomonas ushuaiensis DSM 15871]|uniref:Antirepressor n=1 Tax=Marinomonas ushuaiensis DSM 15871 TaxID=1122207 RepID=X7E1E8_9GAMM|nr:YdaS family helix-turn-helix protein [Marinomonas ushuaiensis]ETX09695.1 hypothetical protein MUS1_06245 [Marinomonas ushuaiensis DSM 15871]
MTAILRAAKIIGTQTKLANSLGIRQAHVWNWINVHNRAPAKYIRRISHLTNNAVTVCELLMDHEVNSSKPNKNAP